MSTKESAAADLGSFIIVMLYSAYILYNEKYNGTFCCSSKVNEQKDNQLKVF